MLRVTLNSLDNLEDVLKIGVFHWYRAMPFLILSKSNWYIGLLLRRSFLQHARPRLSLVWTVKEPW